MENRRRLYRRLVPGLLVAAIAVMSTGCHPAPAPPPTWGSDAVGFSPGADLLWMTPAEQARELDAMADAGATWLRLDFPWPSLQPSPDEWNWAPFDRAVAAAHARGLKVLGLLSYSPRWARRTPSAGVAPFDTAAFATFAGTSVRHFGPRGVNHWEVWNEQNLERSWGAPPDARAYSRALLAASAAIRAADPGATVLGGGLAPATDADDGSEVAPLTFAAAMYDVGANRAFDALAVHPYSYPAMPDDPTTAEWNTFLGMSDIRSLMVHRGDGDKPIWLTEMGAPTGTAPGAVSEATQARYVSSALAAWAVRPWAGPILWYSVRDRSGDRSAREDNFGLFRHDFTAKPGYGAFVSAVEQMPAAGGS